MRQINLKVFVVVSLVFILFANSYSQRKSLSKAEAIRLAEIFIVQNGYTDLPPDKSKIAFESIEWESDINEILKSRYDTLERKAYGIAHRTKDTSGWTVIFRYKHPSYQEMRKSGRAVTMKLDGSNMGVEHKDFILKYVDKKL